MLTIWGRLNSHNVKKAVWAAEEIGVPYVRHDVGGKFGFPEDYAAKNPNLLVPTIEHEGHVLWESNTIVRYLAATHPDAGFWSADPAARAIADRWMDWQFTFAEASRPAFVNLVRTPPERRDAAAIAKSAEGTGALMTILDAALAATPWLSGEAFGIGDIPMGVYAHTWFTLDIPRPSVPHVEAWHRKLGQRAAYAEYVAIPLS